MVQVAVVHLVPRTTEVAVYPGAAPCPDIPDCPIGKENEPTGSLVCRREQILRLGLAPLTYLSTVHLEPPNASLTRGRSGS